MTNVDNIKCHNCGAKLKNSINFDFEYFFEKISNKEEVKFCSKKCENFFVSSLKLNSEAIFDEKAFFGDIKKSYDEEISNAKKKYDEEIKRIKRKYYRKILG